MFISSPPESDATEKIYESSRQSQGFVMNLTNAWGWRPDIFDSFAALRGSLTSASALDKRDQAVMVCATAAQLGDAYCSLAWGRTLTAEAGAAVAAAVISNQSNPNLTARDQALATWARKVVADPNGTCQADVDALRLAGLDDKTIFEATVFIALRLAFSSVNDALGIAPDAELAKALSAEVVQSVNFGRV